MRPPIGPIPANAGVPRGPKSRQWGRTLWLLITLTVAFAAFFTAWSERPSGEVTLLVRDLDGTRHVSTLTLNDGSLTSRVDIDPSEITTLSARVFALSDASVVTLGTPGIIRYGGALPSTSVLVASPVAPLLTTPLSVWGDGARVAWVNPTDRSVQVFVRSEQGSYLPGYLNGEMRPNSLGFSDDGQTLVLGKIEGESTKIHAVRLSTGAVTHIATLRGFISVVPTP